MKRVLRLYYKKPQSLGLKMYLFLTKLQSSFIIEPLTYFRVIKLSQGENYMRAMKVLPIYLREGIKRYINQFRD